MEKTLEIYLSDNIKNGIIDFAIRAHDSGDGIITFYIHPVGVDGDTLDFKVNGNILTSFLYYQTLPSDNTN